MGIYLVFGILHVNHIISVNFLKSCFQVTYKTEHFVMQSCEKQSQPEAQCYIRHVICVTLNNGVKHA